MDCERIVNPHETDLAPIRAAFEAWKSALRSGDLEAVVEACTEDAEFWTHGQPPLRGRRAAREAFEPLFRDWSLEQDFECEELIVAGPDFVFVRGTESNRLVPHAGGDEIARRQRAFSVLHRGEDGIWRFARGMTNAPPPDTE